MMGEAALPSLCYVGSHAKRNGMSERAVTRMSAEEFLEWGLHQDLRYELVDGVPVAMTGANQRHDLVVLNALADLHTQLRGKKCRGFTADIAVRIPAGNIRRPDAGIDCADFDEGATTAGAPFLVMEVLSPSTRGLDMFRKLEEYKTIPSLAHIVLIDPDTPQASHWSRPAGEGWRHAALEGLEAIIKLPEIGCAIDLAALYDGLTFRNLPRLVRDDGPVG
jgi:Uma2 family endonuclease